MYQVVVDTHVLFSATRSRRGASYRLSSLIGDGRWQMNLSVPLVLECEDVVKRPDSGVGRSEAEVDDILDFICVSAHRAVTARSSRRRWKKSRT